MTQVSSITWGKLTPKEHPVAWGSLELAAEGKKEVACRGARGPSIPAQTNDMLLARKNDKVIPSQKWASDLPCGSGVPPEGDIGKAHNLWDGARRQTEKMLSRPR